MKKLTIETSNDDRNEEGMLKSEKFLAQMKAINGHATWNVFKRWKNVIDETLTLPLIPRPPTPRMVCELFVNELTYIPSSSLGLVLAYILSGKA